KANALLELDIDGKTELVLVKDVQKDPVRQIIEHLDLIVIHKGEKVQIEVPVHVTGETVAGTIADLDAKTLLLEAEATHIPENVVVDVGGLEEGAQIFAKDIELPRGSSLISDPDISVVSLVPSEISTSASVQMRLKALIALFGEDELGHVLRVTNPELLRLDEASAKKSNALDALAGLERVAVLATNRWGSAAIDWLRGPNIVLEGARPMDVLELDGPDEVIRAIRLSAA
ncbi:50S ribosomal protein L25, partial [Leifsonia flava]